MKKENVIEQIIDLLMAIKEGIQDCIALKQMATFPFEKEEYARAIMSIGSNIMFSVILGALITVKIAEPLMQEMLYEIEIPIITWGICSFIANQIINEIIKEVKEIIEEGIC